jgi:alkylation response protein AidB-like acyl-CoA dehydrogenase
MDLSLTTEQHDLQQSVRRFVRDEITVERLVAESQADVGFDAKAWRKMAELGWLSMAIPEDQGGIGASLTDVAVLFEELGRGPVAGPLFESGVLAPHILLALGPAEMSAEVLGLIANGDVMLTVALSEHPLFPTVPSSTDVVLTGGAGARRLQGRALFVREAMGASHFLVVAPTDASGDRLACAMVPATDPGVTVSRLPGFSPRQFAVTFDAVAVPDASVVDIAPDRVRAVADAVLRSVPVICAYQVGSCGSVYEMTVEYSRQRVQFGKPIGTFQRVQDHVIDLANNMDSARWTTYFALNRLDSQGNGELPRAEIHTAKAVTAEGHYRACTSAHEVHAGIGSDLQYGLAVHTFASRSLYPYMGDPAWHRRQLALTLDFVSSA